MSLPEKIYFKPEDTENEAAIELGDGRVVMLHPCNEDDSDADVEFRTALLKQLAHRYNNFGRAVYLFEDCVERLAANNDYLASLYREHDMRMLRQVIQELKG